MKPILLAIILMGVFGYASAQESGGSVVNSSGGFYENNNLVFEWNVGEISLVNTMQSDDGKYSFTNGVLQPLHNRGRRRAIPIFQAVEVEISPNPTANRVWIQVQTEGTGKMSLMMFNDRGESVYTSEVTYSGSQASTSINMTKVANGTYILYVKLLPSNGFPGKSGSYKIIKIS